MLNIPKNYEMDHNRMKRDLLTAYRRITWKIWVYLKANPDVLAENNNQEIFDQVAKVQTNYYLRYITLSFVESAKSVSVGLVDTENSDSKSSSIIYRFPSLAHLRYS